MRILGIDPGLQHTGWGIIEKNGNKLSYIADGTINSNPKDDLSNRLKTLHKGICEVIEVYKPNQAAIEETFVNNNPVTTLRLGQARGALVLAPALYNIPLSEYAPNKIKKAVVGSGHAQKDQIDLMVKMLLPGATPKSKDSADALAIAICHSSYS
jgi:crossover junction endodeoxyribonuclease RuvC